MKYALSIFFLFQSLLSLAQINNSWIDYDKTYLEISISKDGLYSLSTSELLSFGINAGDISSKKPHIYHHGIETPLKWDGSNLIFFAQKNKGELDSLLYRPFSARPSNTYSLFQDESVYYLTWNEKEITTWPTITSVPSFGSGENYIVKKATFEYNEQYSFNNIIGLLPNLQQSYFEEGEGWTGKFLSMDSAATFNYTLPDLSVEAAQDIIVKLRLNGRSRASHQVLYEVNGDLQADTLRFAPFGKFEKQFSISSNSIQDQKVQIKFIGIKADEYDWFSLSQIIFEYPIKDEFLEEEFYSKENKNLSLGCESCILLENSSRNAFREVIASNGTFSLISNQKYQFFKTGLKPKTSKLVNFKKLDQNTNYLIVTHQSILAGANEYANYRKSKEGGAFEVSVVTTDEVYRQFNFGERSPLAIKNYLEWVSNGNFKGKQLFLLGRGISFPDVLKTWKDRDLVPTLGYPGSDVMLSAGLDSSYDPDVQSISTGRLNVTKNSEIIAYLNKVKEIENAPIAAEWKKNFAHLSGGKTILEISSLSQTLENITPFAKEGLIGADVESFIKRSTDEIEDIDISADVNEGLGMLAFAGHGSANVIDLNIGYCSPPENSFNNKGKYPVMYFNGCGVGNVFYRYDPLTTDWLLTPDKGAIAVFANSFWSYQFSTEIFLNAFYKTIFQDSSTVGLTLGELHKEVNQSLRFVKFNPFVLSNIHQLILQGDPAIKFFPLEKVDYAIENSSIFITSQNLGKAIAQNEQLNIGVVVKNLGRYDQKTGGKAELSVLANGQTKKYEIEFNNFARVDTLLITIANVAIEKINVLISSQDEYTLVNNSAELTISDWNEVKVRTSYPANAIPDKIGPLVFLKVDNKLLENNSFINPNGKKEIILIDENPLTPSINKLNIDLKRCPTCDFEPITVSNVIANSIYELSFTPDLPLSEGAYEIRIIGFDDLANTSRTFLRKFLISAEQKESEFKVFPNPAKDISVVSVSIVAPENPTNATINIFNNQGLVMKEEKWQLTVGQNEKSISVNQFPIGVYFVKTSIDWPNGTKEELVKKLIVRGF